MDNFLEEVEALKGKATQKRKNSKQKGNRGELELCKILEKHFGQTFKRVPQSGAHVGGVNYNNQLREDAIEILASDIICPKDFLWSLEHKNYNNDSVRIGHLLSEKNYDINEWWVQCKEDAEKSKKRPMLIVKLDRAERFCVIKLNNDILSLLASEEKKNYVIYMNNNGEQLLLINLKELLSIHDREKHDIFWGLKKK